MTFDRMLDTNTLSELVHEPAGRVAAHLRDIQDFTVCASIISSAELRFGAAKNGSSRLKQRVEQVLSAVAVVPFQSPADGIYGDLRAALARAGRPLSANDLLIAAHSLALGITLVTHDAAFQNVPGLTIEDWLT